MEEKKTIEDLVVIETSYGNIKVKLYNETPLHRDNFLKLVGEGFYKDLLFHRIIKDFMIQGGDPNSRTAADGASLGEGDLGYTVDAEFRMPHLFHKKGALSAARMGDDSNPTKASSACQFYIVTGNKYTEGQLQGMERQQYERLRQQIVSRLHTENMAVAKELYKSGNKDSLAEFRAGIRAQAEEETKARSIEAKLSPEQREAYSTIGGTPHLDGEYTVFGEVIEGLEVVDKIQAVAVNRDDRPCQNIAMDIARL